MSSVIYGFSNILKDNENIWPCQGTMLQVVLLGAKHNFGWRSDHYVSIPILLEWIYLSMVSILGI